VDGSSPPICLPGIQTLRSCSVDLPCCRPRGRIAVPEHRKECGSNKFVCRQVQDLRIGRGYMSERPRSAYSRIALKLLGKHLKAIDRRRARENRDLGLEQQLTRHKATDPSLGPFEAVEAAGPVAQPWQTCFSELRYGPWRVQKTRSRETAQHDPRTPQAFR
jgi:hypothetical protein